MPASNEEKLAAAMKAVRHVLRRINEDPAIAYLMGHYTESYDSLCQAVATHDGCTKESVEDNFPPCPPPGAPVREDRETVTTLSDLAVQVCIALNIAPLVAARVIAFAERTGRPLQPYPSTASQDEKFRFEGEAHAAFLGSYGLDKPTLRAAA